MGEPRLGTIDVGSNAIRLRIAELDANGAVRDVSSARASVRLGRDVFRSGHLSKTTLDQATRALASFREIMESAGVSSYRAVATSATREASNGADFVLRAEREAGIDLETIDGHEEARLVNVAVAGALRLAGRVALADVGGGSTEITLLDGRRRLRSASLPLGTVRLLEAWNPEGGAVGRRKLGILTEVVDRALVDVASDLGRAERLVATGGTVTALAKLCGRDGHGVSVARLAHLLERLRRMSEDERVTSFGLRRDRADTILPAAVILTRIASATGATMIEAPGVGIRDGILAELATERSSSRATGVQRLNTAVTSVA